MTTQLKLDLQPERIQKKMICEYIFFDFIAQKVSINHIYVSFHDYDFLLKLVTTAQFYFFRPSFKLIDDDSEEGCSIRIHIRHKLFLCALYSINHFSNPKFFAEKEPYVTMEEDDCVVINEHTVFDHIREKAKCFPSLSSLNQTSPASEKPTLKRKSLVENASPEFDPLFQYDSIFGLPTNKKDIKQSPEQITSPGYTKLADNTGA